MHDKQREDEDYEARVMVLAEQLFLHYQGRNTPFGPHRGAQKVAAECIVAADVFCKARLGGVSAAWKDLNERHSQASQQSDDVGKAMEHRI